MPEIHHFTIPQHEETKAVVHHYGPIHFRYAYARSADTRANQAQGQDFIAIAHTDARLAFVVCDGVSQSFFGDLASRMLGVDLLDWMLRLLAPLDVASPNFGELADYLTSLTVQATEQVAAFQYPAGIPGMVQAALEKKRALGSESTFVAGLINYQEKWFSLAWMGDSRLRIWDGSGEQSDRLGNNFLTGERWSTRKGMVGNLHVYSDSLNSLTHLLAYTDGFSKLNSAVKTKSPSNAAIDLFLDEAFRQPNSDDACLFEWWSHTPRFDHPPDPLANLQSRDENADLIVSWPAVDGATRYEVDLRGKMDESLETIYTESLYSRFTAASRNKGAVSVCVRTLRNDEPSEWKCKALFEEKSQLVDDAQPPVSSSESSIPAFDASLPALSTTISEVEEPSAPGLPPVPPVVVIDPPSGPPVISKSSQFDAAPGQQIHIKKKSKRKPHLLYFFAVPLVVCIFATLGTFLYQSLQPKPAVVANERQTVSSTPVILDTPTAAVTPSLIPTAQPTTTVETPTPIVEVTPTAVSNIQQAQLIGLDNLMMITPTDLPLSFEEGFVPVEGAAPIQPVELLFATGILDENGSAFTALAVFPSLGSEVEAVSRVYTVRSPIMWEFNEVLPAFSAVAVSNTVIAGVYPNASDDGAVDLQFGMWQKSESGWQPLAVAIAPDNVCALAFLDTDLFVLEKNWTLSRYPAETAYQDVDTVLTADEQTAAQSTRNPLCTLALAPDSADPAKAHLAASIDTYYLIADIRIDENGLLQKRPSNGPVRQFAYSSAGWWITGDGVVYLRDSSGGHLFDTSARNSGIAVSPVDGTALVVPGDPAGVYQAYIYDVRSLVPQSSKPVPTALPQPEFRKADRVYFSPDGKFIVTLSSTDGMKVWFSLQEE